jgi:hypothetical protein
MLEAILAGIHTDPSLPFQTPVSKEAIIGWLETYPVKFTPEQADTKITPHLHRISQVIE